MSFVVFIDAYQVYVVDQALNSDQILDNEGNYLSVSKRLFPIKDYFRLVKTMKYMNADEAEDIYPVNNSLKIYRYLLSEKKSSDSNISIEPTKKILDFYTDGIYLFDNVKQARDFYTYWYLALSYPTDNEYAQVLFDKVRKELLPEEHQDAQIERIDSLTAHFTSITPSVKLTNKYQPEPEPDPDPEPQPQPKPDPDPKPDFKPEPPSPKDPPKIEEPVETTPVVQKASLPATGESGVSTIFMTSILSGFIGLGLIMTNKRNEQDQV